MTSRVLVQMPAIAVAPMLSVLDATLESLFPIRIVGAADQGAQLVARIVDRRDASERRPSDVMLPTLALPSADADSAEVVTAEVRFADSPEVPWPFRGQSLSVGARLDAGVQASFGDCDGVEVMAVDGDGRPIWTVDRRGPAPFHRTALRPPRLQAGADLGLELSGERFIQVLPLFEFLRTVTRARRLADPVLRAGFIIDDPNLHWPNYGYANYREIALAARREHFHVAFATIPLDAWWAHAPTVKIFARHTQELSLLIHGNNHAKDELALKRSPEECALLLRQAIARTRRLESRSGLTICRVMVPPHGACSSQVLSEMPRQGFEAACISAGSLRFHNPNASWARTLGLAPSELPRGCPVLPRWAFAGMSTMGLRTAAYLGQPLILRGHHCDLKDGIEILRHFAGAINSLGEVEWGSISRLSRLNYRHRVEGSTLRVQPLGLHCSIAIPGGVDRLVVEPDGFHYDLIGPDLGSAETFAEQSQAVLPGMTYSLLRLVVPDVDARRAPLPATGPKLLLRRLLTETRDRLRIA